MSDRFIPSKIRQYWEIAQKYSNHNAYYAIYIFFDLIICKLFYASYLDDYILYEFYKFNHQHIKSFITNKKQMRLWREFNSKEAIHLFTNKPLFNKKFSQFMHRQYILATNATTDESLNFIKQHNTVIVKPVDGVCGKGIYRLKSNNPKDLESFIISLQSNSYLVEEIIENEESLKKLNPSSLNTVRVVTCLDKALQPHIIKAVLRIGTNNSCTDNVHNGGIVCSINTEHGIIDSYAYNSKGDKYIVHPLTNTPIVGFKIPGWEKLPSYIKEVARIETGARYVGWDIAITPNGFELLEGNTDHAADVFQMCSLEGQYKQVLSYL